MMRRVLFALAFALALPVGAQELRQAPAPLPTDTELELSKLNSVQEVAALGQKWWEEKDIRRYTYAMQRLVQLRPYNPVFQYRLAEAFAMQDMKTPAYDTLIKLQKSGMAMDPSEEENFAKIRGTGAYKYIVEGLQLNATPWGEGKVAFSVKGGPELLESIAHDARNKRFLMGSVRTGEVVAVDLEGRSKVFIKPDGVNKLRAVTALAVDAERKFLWVATAAMPQHQGFRQADVGKAALVKFDLDSGKHLATFEAPYTGRPYVFGALALAKSGEVYATEGVNNAVWQQARSEFKPLFVVPGTSLRGITVSPDHKFVYFSDYELGLRYADLGKNEVRELTSSGQNLGGIEGMAWYDNHLIVVQNTTIPTRVSRIELTQEGRALGAMQPLEANKDELLMPTYGTLVGEDFYFIANSQRDEYLPNGTLPLGTEAAPRQIYKLSARFAWRDPNQKGTQGASPSAAQPKRSGN